MKSFKVAAVLAHHFEQCSKEKQFRAGSGQDVDGFVARPRLVTSELMKVFGGRLRMQKKLVHAFATDLKAPRASIK